MATKTHYAVTHNHGEEVRGGGRSRNKYSLTVTELELSWEGRGGSGQRERYLTRKVNYKDYVYLFFFLGGGGGGSVRLLWEWHHNVSRIRFM